MRILILICLLLLVSAPVSALNLFACEAEWGALAEELGGDKVTIHTATTGAQDVHHIQARPSLLAKARNADLLVCTGAGLEAGWLPLLLRKSGNPRIQPGATGHFMASDWVEMRERPAELDRRHGDIHAAGNPHIQTDPHNILEIAGALGERLAKLDEENAETYRRNLESFRDRWKGGIKEWEVKAKPLQGMPVVVYHKGWAYLQAWLGLEVVAILEPKPGIPPTASHLGKVMTGLKQQPARAVLHASYQDDRPAHWLAGKTGLPVIALPASVGGTEEATDLFSFFDSLVDRLLMAI